MRAWVRIPLLTNLFRFAFMAQNCNIEGKSRNERSVGMGAWFKSRICQPAFFFLSRFYFRVERRSVSEAEVLYGILLSNGFVSGSQDGRAV